jgi:CRISP-associated protein Cas1
MRHLSDLERIRAMNLSSQVRQVEADALLATSDIYILSGLGAHVSVHRGMLHIQQGSTHGETPPARTFQRGVHHLSSLFLLSNDGSVSLAALEWCQEQGISVCKLRAMGEHLSVVLPAEPYNALLRRKQYCLSDEQVLSMARYVLRAKTVSQIHTLQALQDLPKQPTVDERFLRFIAPSERQLFRTRNKRLDPGAARLEEGLIELDDEQLTLHTLRLLEARLAPFYYAAFAGLPLQWKEADRDYIPPSWFRIKERGSEVSTYGSPRHATHPFNAALNYLYAVTEHLLELACQVRGLDPACAVLHADQQNRPSLVYDLIEPLRPVIDLKLLQFFRRTVLQLGDMETLKSGEVRFNPDFTQLLLASCRVPVQEVEAVVGDYLQQLQAL